MIDVIAWMEPPPEGWHEESIRALVAHALRGADCISHIDLAIECWDVEFFQSTPRETLEEIFALICLSKRLDFALASGLPLIDAAEDVLQSAAWKDLCEFYGFDHRRVVAASMTAIV